MLLAQGPDLENLCPQGVRAWSSREEAAASRTWALGATNVTARGRLESEAASWLRRVGVEQRTRDAARDTGLVNSYPLDSGELSASVGQRPEGARGLLLSTLSLSPLTTSALLPEPSSPRPS